ncbi:hypothetical protein BJ912DRAFT_1049229, partial [Pholiota molesta]
MDGWMGCWDAGRASLWPMLTRVSVGAGVPFADGQAPRVCKLSGTAGGGAGGVGCAGDGVGSHRFFGRGDRLWVGGVVIPAWVPAEGAGIDAAYRRRRVIAFGHGVLRACVRGDEEVVVMWMQATGGVQQPLRKVMFAGIPSGWDCVRPLCARGVGFPIRRFPEYGKGSRRVSDGGSVEFPCSDSGTDGGPGGAVPRCQGWLCAGILRAHRGTGVRNGSLGVHMRVCARAENPGVDRGTDRWCGYNASPRALPFLPFPSPPHTYTIHDDDDNNSPEMLLCPMERGLGALGVLPHEILQHILFLLVAQTPLGPPSALIPVRLTSKALDAVAGSAALLRRVFRLKFDAGAVTRRLFDPSAQDLAAQLVASCRVLRSLRKGLPARPGDDAADAGMGSGSGETTMRGSVEREREVDMGVEDTLFGALLLMLDNDGRNFAQLEHAGVHAYVDAYVARRLWDGARDNAGWPVEDAAGACALWVMWLTIDRERLVAETPLERENVVLSILPFVFLIHRYPASEAPPNHFHLPLRDASAAVSGPSRTRRAPRSTPRTPRASLHTGHRRQRTRTKTTRRTTGSSRPTLTISGKQRTHRYPHPFFAFAYADAHRAAGARPAAVPALPPRARAVRAVLPRPIRARAALGERRRQAPIRRRREVRPFGVPGHLPRDRADAVRRWWGVQVEAARAMQAQAVAAGQQHNLNHLNHHQHNQQQNQHQHQHQQPAAAQALPIPPMPAHIQPPLV